MPAPAVASGSTELPANSNRRRGWVIASEEGEPVPVARPTKFDARSSAAAWNKGKGPSPASIPSRASSLAPTPASQPTPALPPLSFQLEPEQTLEPIQPPAQQQLPPQSLPRRQLNSSIASSDGESDADATASNGKRRPSPPLLVPPKQTYRKSPSVKVLPPSAYTDHKRMMAGVGLANRSPKPASPSAARTTFASATALIPSSPPKGNAQARRAQQASSSSTASTSSAGFDVAPTPHHAANASGSYTSSEASSITPTAEPSSPSAKGKERALDSPELPASANDASSAAYRRNHPSVLSSVTPMPPVSERSSTSDRESSASPAPEAYSPSSSGAALRKKPSDLRIELPPSSTDSQKPAYPAIMVDSTHVSEGPSVANGGIRPRKRRSTGSAQTDNGDEEIDDDDNSSWPSTPSTTPLDYYFSDAAVLKAAAKNAHHQTTTQIVSADPNVLSMGMPMVVVTSPSTASEVSSERRSSASSSAPSDSSVPSVPTVTPAPALPKVTEEPTAAEEEATPRAAKKSLAFDVPAAREAAGAEPKAKSYNFFAKMGPSKASNRNSVEAPAPAPLAQRTSVDVKRQSGEQRRSVELKPILLHTAAKKSSEPSTAADIAPSRAPARTEQQQQRRMSGGRVPVRSNVVPYHSQQTSEGSVTSSSPSVAAKRMSLDRAGDPRFSPASHVSTAITVPSPVIATKRPPPIKPVVVASSSQNRFAASMPSLHQPPADEPHQTETQEPPSPSAIRQLIDSQKGRTTKDNDSIAEWISVSHNDVPATQNTHPYGNGGTGEFSNQKREPKKRLSAGKPWKSNRFAVSEAALPTATPAAKDPVRPQHPRVRSASSQSLVTPPISSLKPNLGFTTAARNAVLQSLYAGRSVSALAAGSVIAASMGRVSVPSATRLAQLKANAKKQAKAEKKLKNKSGKTTAPAAPAVASKQVEASPKPEEAEVRLNLSENRHSLYDLQHGVGTVNSMMPELGNWTDPTDSFESPAPAAQPFRDYEDDESDLFDSGSDSDDDGDWAGEDEEAEVPVRLGQRSKEPEMLNVFFSSLRSNNAPAKQAATLGASPDLNADTPVVRSPSLANVAPGSVEHKGKEIRLCVDEGRVAATGTDTTAIWKAVKVNDLDKSSCNDGGYLELKRQKQARQNRTKAMKLESEVSRGVFASFVGNNSPVRQAKRSSTDLSRSPNSPTKASRAMDAVDDELFITKEDRVSYVVRRTALPGTGPDQLLEIVRRSSTGSWLAPNHLSNDLPLRYQINDQDTRQRQHLPGTPVFNLDKAFPSPFLGSESSGHSARRQESSATTGSTLTSDEDETRRVLLRVHREDATGFEASFNAHDGSAWVWKARALATDTEPSDETLATGLNGFDLHLYTVQGANTVELASYTTESQLRNALGLFQARGKRAPKPLPEDAAEVPVVTTQVTPLAAPAFGGSQIRADAAPRRGIRGGPLLRHQASAGTGVGAPGSAAWKQRQWQNQRAAISTESVVQVHNNAVANARSSHLVEIPARKLSADAQPAPVSQGKRKGELLFQPDCQDRDLAVVSLLALLGMVRT